MDKQKTMIESRPDQKASAGETEKENTAEEKALQRASLLFGSDGIKRLTDSCVLVAGCGGVGSFAVEALARSGIGRLILIDHDTVEESNINRQLCALHSTIGQEKTKILRQRIADIAPKCQVECWSEFYDSGMNERIRNEKVDYILDCIDSISSKKDLISFAVQEDIPLISSMGMARRMDPSKIEIAELEKTWNDPLAKILRVWKRKSRIRRPVMTVFSSELPVSMEGAPVLPSSIFVPASAGLMMASWCVKNLMKDSAPKEPAQQMGGKTKAEQ